MKKVFAVMLAAVLIFAASVPVFAAESPTASTVITVVVKPSGGGSGSYEVTTEPGKNGGTVVHFTPKPNPGYGFDHWEIQGDYIIISGSLEEGNLVIEAFSDIVATPIYTMNGETTATIQNNTGKTSPQTGNTTSANGIAAAAALVAAAGIGCLLIKRRINSK